MIRRTEEWDSPIPSSGILHRGHQRSPRRRLLTPLYRRRPGLYRTFYGFEIDLSLITNKKRPNAGERGMDR